jgi:hypothetical protein
MNAYLNLTSATPGSSAAKSLGCLCPVIDNGHGRGAYIDAERGPQFWITDRCPLHGADHQPARIGRGEA